MRQTRNRHAVGFAVRISACATLALTVLVGCRRVEQQRPASDAATDAASTSDFPSHRPTALPKVPFNQQPCQSLSAADEAALQFVTPVHAVPHKETPDSLPYDNACRWYNGGTELTLIGYMTQQDYDATSQGMRSTERVAPSDIPGAFYDRVGYLWFTKNGYYVEVGPGSHSREAVARVLVPKL